MRLLVLEGKPTMKSWILCLGVEGKPTMKSWILCLGVGAAIAVIASPPALAQFMTGNYPVIIVPPPPAQNLVVPKPKPIQPPKPDGLGPSQLHCHYQGQTRSRTAAACQRAAQANIDAAVNAEKAEQQKPEKYR